MTRRAKAWLLGLVFSLLFAGCGPDVPPAAEEQGADETDLARFLEGFAPLAARGEWTRTEEPEGDGPKVDFVSGERPRGLQDALRLTFAAADKSRVMSFLAARFESAAQAEAFLAADHEALLQMLRQQAAGPLASVWLQEVSEGAGEDGTLDGYVIDWVVEALGSPFRLTSQQFHVGRLFVSLSFVGRSHVSRETQYAFIAFALRRLTDPDAVPPPSPDVQVPTREVTLSLRDEAGEPVASAEAVAWTIGSEGPGPVVPLRDRGTMTLPREPVKIRFGHAAGMDGRPLQVLAGEAILDSQQTEATVTLPRGEPCRIQVVGPEGEPVPGVEVRTLSERLRLRPPVRLVVAGRAACQDEKLPPVGAGKGVTAADGGILLPLDPKHGSLIAVDAGEDYFPAVEEVLLATESKTIRLRPAWVLHVEVRDSDGTPVEGTLLVRVEGETRYHDTDADGRARIGPLPRETMHVRSDDDDLAGQEVWTEVRPTRDPVVLTLASHVLRLRVVDSAGVPVPRYWVEVDTGLRSTGHSAENPATLLVPPGRCSVEVRRAEDADGHPLDLAPAGASVSGEERELTLRMPPGVRMTGTVRTADGRPVADAEVIADLDFDMISRAKTDAEGRYTLVGLVPRAVTVKVSPPEGLGPPRPREVVPSSAGPSADFTLPEVVPITVVDWRGRPVHGAYVRVEVVGNGPEAGTFPIETHTNEDGVAYLTNLYPDQELFVMPQNSVDLASLRRPWDGARTTVRLERAHTVRVRVLDGRGPVVGAEIEVEAGEDYADDTGPEGCSDVLLPYRPMRLRARRDASAPWGEWVRVEPRESEAEVRVPDAER